MSAMYEVEVIVGCDCKGQFFTMQLVSNSFASHVTCKVKYFGKVANVFEGKTIMCFAALSFHEPNQLYQLWFTVDHKHNQWNLVTRRQ